MGLYVTTEQVNDYISGGAGLEDAELEKVIAKAQRDIDRASGYRDVDPDTGFFFTPDDLEARTAEFLSRATAAQVEYRLTKGEEFFIEAQVADNRNRREPRIGPKAIEELSQGGLRVTTGTMI